MPVSKLGEKNGKLKKGGRSKQGAIPASFPVAAIGASAGGIEALSNFLEHIPDDLGIAYVIIQHISASRESILPQILERKTSMKVHQVKNGMPIEPDNVYVIPPNHYMSIVDGHLLLSPPPKTKGSVHSIDFFLSALAKVYQHNAIAIILSGTAYDGSEGVKEIKAEGGITFAQDESAKFPGMPIHASETGAIDFVMSPEKIAEELAVLARLPYGIKLRNDVLSSQEDKLKKIYQLLHQKKAVDFSYYKKSTINRRILRRMSLNRLKDPLRYLELLRNDSKELTLLYKDLLINVTSFFRDPAVYKALTKIVFPAILKKRKEADVIRIWSPACATGEEAYSIAISLFEFLKDKALAISVQVFGTDLNEGSIEKARAGIYTPSALINVSPQRLSKFFTKIDGKYQIVKSIRDVCIFAPHNLLSDPPFSHMDVISCQNVMIYLEANPQKKLLQMFHYALRPTGFLLLGKSESIGNSIELFSQYSKDLKLYTPKAAPMALPLFDFTLRSPKVQSLPGTTKKTLENKLWNEVDVELAADKLLLQKYVASSVLVNKDLHIIRFHGRTSDFLQPSSGKASLHLFKMVKEELLFELRSLIARVKKEGRLARKEGILFAGRDHQKEITIEVTPIRSGEKNAHYLIVFTEKVIAPSKKQVAPGNGRGSDQRLKIIGSLEKEISDRREEFKTLSEEFEGTREELQTANEEVLSSNEELQSINEELETSKEELQSANEELITMNEELRIRNSELRESRDYALAIVETIHEPLFVLDQDHTIRTANKAFYTLFRTSPELTEGRYLFGLHNEGWNIVQLRKALTEIAGNKKTYLALEIKNKFPVVGEKIFCFHIMQMDENENIRGRILVAIEDITQRKISELQLKQSEENFRLLVQNSADIITVFSAEGDILYQSESVKKILGFAPEEMIGKNIFRHSLVHPEDRFIKETMFQQAQATSQESIVAEFRLRHKDGSYRVIEGACINQLNDERVRGIVANYRDITEKKKLEKQKEEFISVASHELKTPVTSIKAYAQLLAEKFKEEKDRVAVGWAGKLEKQVDRLNHLIGELLDTTRISEGQIRFEEELFDMGKLIREKVQEIQVITTRHKIISRVKKGPEARGDRERIGQVLVNYLSNAVKYSPQANKVIVTCTYTKKDIIVSVQDFGIGIPPTIRTKVFDRFFRANNKNVRTFPGLGLGLYISSEIIIRQGGKVWVESSLNKGSTFFFSLPLPQN